MARINLFSSLVTKVPVRDVSLYAAAQAMRLSGQLDKLCNKYRTELNEGIPDKAKWIKRTMIPAIAPSAYMFDGKSRNNVLFLAGYGMLDYDHITEEQIDLAKQILSTENHTILAANSISNQGLHIIFQYVFGNMEMPSRPLLPVTMNRIYKSVVRQIASYYDALLDLKSDANCFAAEQMMLL